MNFIIILLFAVAVIKLAFIAYERRNFNKIRIMKGDVSVDSKHLSSLMDMTRNNDITDPYYKRAVVLADYLIRDFTADSFGELGEIMWNRCVVKRIQNLLEHMEYNPMTNEKNRLIDVQKLMDVIHAKTGLIVVEEPEGKYWINDTIVGVYFPDQAVNDLLP